MSVGEALIFRLSKTVKLTLKSYSPLQIPLLQAENSTEMIQLLQILALAQVFIRSRGKYHISNYHNIFSIASFMESCSSLSYSHFIYNYESISDKMVEYLFIYNIHSSLLLRLFYLYYLIRKTYYSHLISDIHLRIQR